MYKKPLTIAAIPACDEKKNIAEIVLLAQKYVDKVIVCDDGSGDMTGEIARRLGAEVIRHERNIGYGAAIGTLFREAKKLDADIMVTLDGDGQHDPNKITKLVQPIVEGKADIVIGSRFLTREGKEEVPRYRRMGIKAITNLTRKASRIRVTDAQSGYRAFNKKAILSLAPVEQGMGASTEILLKAIDQNLRITEIPMTIAYKGIKTSIHRSIYNALDVIMSIIKFTSMRHPLLFYGVPGVVALFVGLSFGLWTAQIYAATSELNTSVTLISIGATMMGLLLMFTAIILSTLITLVRETGE